MVSSPATSARAMLVFAAAAVVALAVLLPSGVHGGAIPNAAPAADDAVFSALVKDVGSEWSEPLRESLRAQGCSYLKCGITVAKIAACIAKGGSLPKDPKEIIQRVLKCTNKDQICPCVDCLPSLGGLRDAVKALLCGGGSGAAATSYDLLSHPSALGSSAEVRAEVLQNAATAYGSTASASASSRGSRTAAKGDHNALIASSQDTQDAIFAAIVKEAGPSYAVSLRALGCSYLSCGIMIGKCAAAAAAAYASGNPALILACTSRTKICECLDCLPSTGGIRDWIKSKICDSSDSHASSASSSSSDSAVLELDRSAPTYDSCVGRGYKGNMPHEEAVECAPVVAGHQYLAMRAGSHGRYNVTVGQPCGCPHVCIGHCIASEACEGTCL